MGEVYAVDQISSAPRTTGVYSITNIKSGRVYIGSAAGAKGFLGRWQEHRRDLDAGVSCSVRLQRAWLKHGRDAFRFTILEVVDRVNPAAEMRSRILAAEQRHIDAARAADVGYNTLPVAGSRLGKRLTDEQRAGLKARVAADPEWLQRLAKNSKGRTVTPETRALISSAAKERWADAEWAGEVAKAMADAIREKGGHSAEHRAAISRARTGQKMPDEVKAKMKASQRGLWTDERREAHSQRLKAALAAPEVKAKKSAAATGRRHSPETLAKMRAAQQKRYADPEEAARMKEAQQRGAAAKRERTGRGG